MTVREWVRDGEIRGRIMFSFDDVAKSFAHVSRQVKCSSAELTAVELVQYEHCLGGLSNVATVIAELLESTDFAFASEGAFSVCKDSSVQRLGYIVEKIIGDERQGEVIYHEWVRGCQRPHYQLLSLRTGHAVVHRDERWKVDVNTTVEVDEI